MINEETIKQVAQTARIHLTEEETKKFLPQFEEILEAFKQLEEINTEGIEPAFHPIQIEPTTRPDKPEPSLPQEEAMQSTELKEDQYFKGPRAI